MDKYTSAIKERIKFILEEDPEVKQVYDNNEGCFKNIIIPSIMDSDNEIHTMISILAAQAVMYDRLLNNIAQYGDKELIKKCNEDIHNVFAQE